MANKKSNKNLYMIVESCNKDVVHGNNEVFVDGSIKCIQDEFNVLGSDGDKATVYQIIPIGTLRKTGSVFISNKKKQ